MVSLMKSTRLIAFILADRRTLWQTFMMIYKCQVDEFDLDWTEELAHELQLFDSSEKRERTLLFYNK